MTGGLRSGKVRLETCKHDRFCRPASKNDAADRHGPALLHDRPISGNLEYLPSYCPGPFIFQRPVRDLDDARFLSGDPHLS